MKHLRTLCLAAALAGSLGLAATAKAAPMGPGSIGELDSNPTIEQVGGRCGPGWKSTPWGECIPHRRVGPYWGGRYGYRPPPPPIESYYVRPRRYYY